MGSLNPSGGHSDPPDPGELRGQRAEILAFAQSITALDSLPSSAL